MSKIKIAINKSGYLQIRRKDTLSEVYCPMYFKHSICGCWCALFQEPKETMWFSQNDHVKITLCHATYEVETDEFEDNR